MKYQVDVTAFDEDYAAQCPARPACWSQGETPEEAIDSNRAAVGEYLDYLDGKATRGKGEILSEGERAGFRVALREIETPA